MDMNTAGAIYERSILPELTKQLLDRFDIPVAADRRDHLNAILSTCRYDSASFFPLTVKTAVTHELPLTAFIVLNCVGIIAPTYMGGSVVKVFSGHLGCSGPCQSGHLHLNAKILLPQIH